MTISRFRHLTSMALGLSGAFLAGRDRSASTALLGGVVLGAGLGIGSMRRQGARR